jgi:thiol reductant ABC exporter CydD subunit/thiol reductant ABC exporter CydC subunit
MSRGPLGALPALSPSARRALAGCAVLAALSAAALVAQAWALASVLADVVTGGPAPGERLAILVGAVVARALLSWATQVVAARAATGAKEELRAVLLDSALARGPEWISERGPAQLTVLATRGLDALDAYFTTYLPALVTTAVAAPGIGAVILLADWPSAVVIALTIPLIPVFAALVGYYTRDRVALAADSTARLSAHLLEMIRALPVLTAFRRAEAQAEAVRRVSDRQRTATLGTLRIAFSSALVLELVATLSVALVAVIIGVRLVSGDISLATGLFVLILAPECYLPLRAAGAAHHASEDGLEAVRRVAEISSAPTAGGTRVPVSSEVVVSALRARGREFSFRVRPGEVTLLDTRSGSGKSTAISVLLGFVRPRSGSVTVGGLDLSTVDMEEWRRRVAWVPQRPAFTGGTVAEELSVAAPASRTELCAVTREVAAEHLLDRRIMELSTGERQRVAVARALLRVRHGATVLLLDEPTAHLDAATAGRVMAAVHAAAESGVAVLLAAHRVAGPDPSSSPARPVVPVAESGEPTPVRLSGLLSPGLWRAALLGAGALSCAVALTATSAWLIAKAAAHPPILALSLAVVGVRTFGLARAGLRYLERLVAHDAAFRGATDLRVRLWRRLVSLGPARTLSLRGTEGVQRLVDDVDAVRDLTPRVLLPPLVATLTCLVAVIIQALVLPSAGLVLAAAVLLAGLGAPALAWYLDRRSTSALAEGRRRVASGVLGLLDAAADLIAFGAHRRERAAVAAADAALASRARRQAFGAGAAGGLILLVTGLASVGGTALAANAVGAGVIPAVLAPVLALVPLALAEALAPVPVALQHHAALRTAYGRVGAVLDTTFLDAGDASPRAESAGAELRLSDVDVRWPGAREPSLREVTLDVPAGSYVAVVGPSGAGKSTLLAVLLGFLQPERGTVSIPGRVAWCPQEPQLVSTTVRENLRLGDPSADDARLADALHAVRMDHWLDRLDTVIGAGGTGLSGGEAQRLALARALLAVPEADLVVLDEPTAHLDVPTAQEVLAGLRSTLAGRTVVHVTHRLDEIAEPDAVLEVADGRVQVRAFA